MTGVRSAALIAAAIAAAALAVPAPAATLLRVDAFGARGTAPGKLSHPAGIAVARDGTVYVSDTLNGRIQAFDPGGAPLRVIGAPGREDGTFGAPQGLAVAPDGSVWVTDNGRDRIQHFAAVGSLLGAFGSSCLAGDEFQGACEAGFLGPEGVAVAADGSLYVADTRNSRVQRVGTDGGFLSVSSADLKLPEDVAVARDGSVLVTDTSNDRLRRLSPDLGAIRDTIVLPGWRQPVGMTVAPDGCAYFLDMIGGRVGIVSDGGFAGTAVARGTLSQPQAVAAGPDGSVYVADSGHNRVLRYDDPTPATAARGGAVPQGTRAPVLDQLSIAAQVRPVRAKGCATSVAAAAPIGYRVSQRALVTFTVRRDGRAVGRFAQQAGRGSNHRRFAGTIGSRRLGAGDYVLEAVARNSAGSSSRRTDRFTVPGLSPARAASTRSCRGLKTTNPFAGVVIQITVSKIRARNVTCTTARRMVVAYFQTSTAPAGWRYTVHREGAGSHGRLFRIAKPQSIDLWFTSKG